MYFLFTLYPPTLPYTRLPCSESHNGSSPVAATGCGPDRYHQAALQCQWPPTAGDSCPCPQPRCPLSRHPRATATAGDSCPCPQPHCPLSRHPRPQQRPATGGRRSSSPAVVQPTPLCPRRQVTPPGHITTAGDSALSRTAQLPSQRPGQECRSSLPSAAAVPM